MAQRLSLTVLALLAMASMTGCDGGSQDGTAGSGGSGGTEQGGGGTGGENTGGGSTGGAGGGSADLPPTEQNALFQWLKDGSYTGWEAESGPHASTGPHGGDVRTFVNPVLFGSLSAGNTVHPRDAAAVKELYLGGSAVAGWAVELKTADDSAGGQGWYWYELYSATDPSNPVAAGNGVSLCYNCHVSGADYVLTPFPLQ
jgi:hypothetical protein